jgi:protoheme IX farnesyltransferase
VQAERVQSVGEASPLAVARDFVALTKPRITLLVLLTSTAGIAVAPGTMTSPRLWLSLAGTALIVSSANALNMWWERALDARMARTATRPLPAGRLQASHALAFGIALAAASVPMLLAVNLMTTLLGVFALLTYVLVYTPLKTRSWLALLVGAIPGALPPLMGWATVTGRADAGGLALFLVLFLWQVPHFGAISLFRAAEYERAGMLVLAVEKGEASARRTMALFTLLLVLASVLVVPLGVARIAYLAVALSAGGIFLAMSARGLFPNAGARWAKQLFALSIVYLVVWMGALVLDRVPPVV